MVLMGLGVLLAGMMGVVVEAEDTTVTVYKDRTLVERTTTVNLAGTERVVWPLLLGDVDPTAVRVEAEGAEVQQFEVRPTYVPAFTAEQARAAMDAVAPPAPPGTERSYDPERGAASFALTRLASKPSPPALEVTATLKGEGAVKVVLRHFLPKASVHYRVALAVQDPPSQVEATFQGQILQRTGTDWKDALVQFDVNQGAPSFESLRPLPVVLQQPDALEEEALLRRQMFERGGWSTLPVWSAKALQQRAAPVSLSGRVVDVNTGAPLKDTVVSVLTSRLQTEEVFAFTDVRGEYHISNLPPAPTGYRLRFGREGASVQLYEAVAAPAGANLRFDEQLWTGAGPNPEPSSPLTYGCYIGNSPQELAYIDFMVAGVGPTELLPIPPPRDFAREGDTSQKNPMPPAGRLVAPGRHTLRDGTSPRVPLITEHWPMTLHRQVFPAQDPATYLIAEVRPSSLGELVMYRYVHPLVDGKPRTLLKLTPLRPDNTFTLPLGTDPKVQVVRTEQRVPVQWNAREVHDVTLRVPNPYPVPMSVRVLDTWPQGSRLVRATPGAQRDDTTRGLTWDLKVPPSSTGTVSFQYSR
ncbi:carboxypeptidase regulatory-like domain-containing protein [Corallococcus exiguus]|uniref:carboxypeptidase regulatory-like domain-containing protein n=1 Tax=Corallococcus exiguus TaxID=83462 RepID=UPI0014949D5E|nr:carboxypeptidase regulatory-like domain-containing protein [Corallococcus exiguus]NPD24167.1 DUF4139 domain-containing protein [Corallococcus exiguus]